MEWVESFYAKQDAWLGVYSHAVDDGDRARARSIERLAGPGPLRVLELGAGGGQSAAATADLGYTVVAVELVPSAVAHARTLEAQERPGSLTVIQGDFYTVAPDGPFDVVCYWDGFGIGSDEDQQRLLTRIGHWLRPGGCALLDVNTPWYWAAAAGQEMRFDDVVRRYDFDAEGCRMVDRWWLSRDKEHAVTQSLRCYSPADLALLLPGTGLRLDTLEPGGAMDYARMHYTARVPLGQAMQYLARLIRVE